MKQFWGSYKVLHSHLTYWFSFTCSDATALKLL
jgi:hypothetical protein